MIPVSENVTPIGWVGFLQSAGELIASKSGWRDMKTFVGMEQNVVWTIATSSAEKRQWENNSH